MSMRWTTVDTRDPQNRAVARMLVEELVKDFEPGGAVAIAVLTTAELLITILHAESPFPEQNVQEVERILDHLKAAVMAHAPCAEERAEEINRVKH